jgi:hypothetical protein
VIVIAEAREYDVVLVVIIWVGIGRGYPPAALAQPFGS